MRSVSFPLVRALITPSKIDVIITEILEINVNLKVLKKAGPMRSETDSPVM